MRLSAWWQVVGLLACVPLASCVLNYASQHVGYRYDDDEDVGDVDFSDNYDEEATFTAAPLVADFEPLTRVRRYGAQKESDPEEIKELLKQMLSDRTLSFPTRVSPEEMTPGEPTVTYTIMAEEIRTQLAPNDLESLEDQDYPKYPLPTRSSSSPQDSGQRETNHILRQGDYDTTAEKPKNTATEKSEGTESEKSDDTTTEKSKNTATEKSEDKESEKSDDTTTEKPKNTATEKSEGTESEKSDNTATEKSENTATEKSEDKESEKSDDTTTENPKNTATENSETTDHSGGKKRDYTFELPKKPNIPQLNMKVLLELIGNLTADYDTNMTWRLNQSLMEFSIPTCPTPTTVAETTTPLPDYSLVNATIMGKCFVCGLDTLKVPVHAHCADAFAGDFLPLTPVDTRAKGQIANFRKYCRYRDVKHYIANASQPRSIFGRWTGGCSVRWVDVSGIYTQRSCRNRNRPILGMHYASKRMAKLELALTNLDNGCIVSPMATLVPFSRGVSLFARFHACVCTGSWCNMSTLHRPWMMRFALLLFFVAKDFVS